MFCFTDADDMDSHDRNTMEQIEWFVPEQRAALALSWVLTPDGLRMRWTRVAADGPLALVPPASAESDRTESAQAA